MQFLLDKQQIEVKENAERLLKENIDHQKLIEQVSSNIRIDSDLWKLIVEQGWVALDISEDQGGVGFSFTEQSILHEVLGYYLPIVPFLSSGVMFKNLILQTKKQDVLGEIISGDKIGAVAYSEPSTSWNDISTVKTSLKKEGNNYVLNGNKDYVLFGDSSDYYLVIAQMNKSQHLVLLSSDAEGLVCTPTTSLDQTRPLASIEFNNVEVHEDNLLLDGKDLASAWKKMLLLTTAALSVEQVGGATACLEMSVQYAKDRIQFGRPIGSFQAVQHTCADMLLQLESAKSTAYAACRSSSADVVEFDMMSSIARAYCSNAFNKIAGDNIQIHAGIGFTWEHPAHLYFKRAKSDSLMLGSSKDARDRVGKLIGI